MSLFQNRQNSVIFSYEMCHMFLILASSWLVLAFLFTKINNIITNGAYSNSIAITCAHSTHFLYALILLNRGEIDKQCCALSSLHAILTLGKLNILIRHTLPHFTRCSLVTTSFQISWDPISSCAIGCHATWLFISPTSLIIISGNM